MQAIGEFADRRHQLRRPLQRAADRRLELRRIVDVDQLRPRTPVLEGHHRLVGEQELVERGRGVRAHHVHLREQLQDVVVVGETQVLALQRAVAGDHRRVHLRMEGDDPAPFAAAREPRNLVVEDAGRAPRRRERGVVQDHRRLPDRGQFRADLAHERVDLGEAGFLDREVAELARQRAERRGVARAGGAVQIEKAAHVDMPRLAGIEAVEGLDLHPGEEMRHRVAGGDHRVRIPRQHLFHRRQMALVGAQILGAGAVEEPCRLVAARADRRLQRTQDRQRITLGPVQQIVLAHQCSRSCRCSCAHACSTEAGLICIS
ncbi:hypothetical protein NB705_002866 [Xanthomonas sacchari]|nr:hypothetical protein [Xanthomonas sacchari]